MYNFGFLNLITLAFRVLICYKITTRAKLLDNIHMGLVSAVDCSLIDMNMTKCRAASPVAYPGILFGGGGSTNSVKDRGQTERGSRGSSPLVRGSGGSCNLIQEISFHIVRFS